MRVVKYNSQRDNFDFKGQFKGNSQCFSTSAWMLLSYFSQQYQAYDDAGLSIYVDDVSNIVGDPGIGERIKKLYSFITGNSAYWWQVHKAAIDEYLKKVGVNGTTVFKDGNCSEQELLNALKISPVILGTNKMAGLPGGHIILVVDTDGDNLYCNDPFGDATTGYKNTNGEMVKYSLNWIRPFITYNKGKLMRTLWFEKN